MPKLSLEGHMGWRGKRSQTLRKRYHQEENLRVAHFKVCKNFFRAGSYGIQGGAMWKVRLENWPNNSDCPCDIKHIILKKGKCPSPPILYMFLPLEWQASQPHCTSYSFLLEHSSLRFFRASIPDLFRSCLSKTFASSVPLLSSSVTCCPASLHLPLLGILHQYTYWFGFCLSH